MDPSNEDEDIGKTHKFTLNAGFKRYVFLLAAHNSYLWSNIMWCSKKMKVQINVPVPQQVREESDSTHKFVEEDRKLQVNIYSFFTSFLKVINYFFFRYKQPL